MKRKFSLIVTWVLVIMLLVPHIGLAQGETYTISEKTRKAYEILSKDVNIQKGLDFIEADDENTLKEQIEICEIPAPPFKEEVRAEDYMKRLEELGLQDIKMDSEGNVFGIRRGTGDGPKLLVTAHLDTVFPEDTDVTVREKDGIYYAPGIADDSRGLAALLSVVRAFNELGIQTVGDIVFGGDVGEEGLGDLRGVKALFRDNKDFDGYISIDGTGHTSVTYLATGSHRYKITYNGPGGHSFGAFGLPSAIHALGRAISKIGDIVTPKEPRTTFTVGTVEGGTSVNSIAGEAKMLVDMRSNDENELLKVEAKFLEIVKQAVVEENERWESDEITVDIKLVGDRPAGSQSSNLPIVEAAWMSTRVMGQEPRLSGPSSTDSNLPISLGIPAITIGGGGKSGNGHAVTEWYDPTDAYMGPQKIFLTILGLVGVDEITEPLLQKKAEVINLEINGEIIKPLVPPYKEGDIIMIPLRAVFDELGGSVEYLADSKTAKIDYQNQTLLVPIGEEKVNLNDQVITLPINSKLVNNRTMIPIDILTDMGINNVYDVSLKTLIIN